MKIAVFHNYMDNIGGAEIVTLTLARELKAHVYTTNIDKEKLKCMGFEDVIPFIYSIGTLPKNAPFKQQLALLKFRRLNLGKQYDFYIISGDWAMSGAYYNKPNLWYVHSPLNELWQFKNYIRKNIVTWWKRPFYDIWVMVNRYITLYYANHIERWVCNSQNTQHRIKKFYKKEALIIYPPIYTEKYFYSHHKNYWLSVNRLTSHKRIELQINAFSNLPEEKLIIVGSYEKDVQQFEAYRTYIESLKPDNVEILSWVTDRDLKKLYSECKGFINTAQDEDFGMTVVEAMASGKPVIASDEGGYRETVNPLTGILLENVETSTIISAIKDVHTKLAGNPHHYHEVCIDQAKKFDVSVFISDIRKAIQH